MAELVIWLFPLGAIVTLLIYGGMQLNGQRQRKRDA